MTTLEEFIIRAIFVVFIIAIVVNVVIGLYKFIDYFIFAGTPEGKIAFEQERKRREATKNDIL